MKRKGAMTQGRKANKILDYGGGAQRRHRVGVRKRRGAPVSTALRRGKPLPAAVQKIFDEMSDPDGVQRNDHKSPTLSRVLGVLCGYSLV